MGSKLLVNMRHSSKKVEMLVLFVLTLILGVPIGSLIKDVMNRTANVGHSLAYNKEQFQTHPERILSSINDGESELYLFC